MKRRFLFVVAGALGLFAIFFIRSLAGTPERQPNHQTQSAATAPGAKVENGQAAIRLDPKTQERLGIREAHPQAARERKQMTLPAMVLPVQNLASLVSAYEMATAQLQKAEITASVSEREYARLEKLYSDQQNVSAKAVQAAEGVYRGDQVDVESGRQNLSLALAAVRQSWGDAITGWLAHGRENLQRVIRREDVLIEMTLPPGEPFAAPRRIEFNLPAGGRAFARFVSAFPQVDPRVQGVGYLYVTRARPGLAPGINLVAHFGVGALKSGVIIPSSAVVWLHGKAWAYVDTGQETFARREVSTNIPTPGGWFEARGYAPDDPIVTKGAEQILGVELMPPPSSHPPAKQGDGD